jgi:uncharacterized protein YjaZ
MPDWSFHYLDPHGQLEPFRAAVDASLRSVEGRVTSVARPLALDIFVQPGKGVIPELGYVGYAPKAGVIYLTANPDNPNLPRNLGAALERQIAHEFHHALRWLGPGYGRTLLEALVSEGLAGRFVQEVFGSEPEPWECALPRAALPPYAQKALREGETQQYDHVAWFFGRSDLPRWLGYTLGWELVGDFLEQRSSDRPSKIAGLPASEFLPALRALAAT